MVEEKVLLAELKDGFSEALDRNDLCQARFYSLMISELNDRISFNVNAAKQKSLSKAFTRQKKINAKMNFLTKVFMFMIISEMILLLTLIILNFMF